MWGDIQYNQKPHGHGAHHTTIDPPTKLAGTAPLRLFPVPWKFGDGFGMHESKQIPCVGGCWEACRLMSPSHWMHTRACRGCWTGRCNRAHGGCWADGGLGTCGSLGTWAGLRAWAGPWVQTWASQSLPKSLLQSPPMPIRELHTIQCPLERQEGGVGGRYYNGKGGMNHRHAKAVSKPHTGAGACCWARGCGCGGAHGGDWAG